MRWNIRTMNMIQDKSERNPYPKLYPFKCCHHYDHSCINRWIKTVNFPMKKYYLCEILVRFNNIK